VSNPDNAGPYGQEPNRAGPVGADRRGARNGPGREASYGQQNGYGRSGSNGRSNGSGGSGDYRPSHGGRAGNGRPAAGGNGRPAAGGNGRPAAGGNGRPAGYDAPDGSRRRDGRSRDGYARDEYGRGDGYGAGGARRPGSRAADPRGRDSGGWDDPGDSRGGYGRRRDSGGTRGRGSQISSDLRSRLGVGNGGPDEGGARGGGVRGGSGARGGGGPDWPGGEGRRSGRDPETRPGLREGTRAALRQGASRLGGLSTRADVQLRARLGLRSEPGPASGGAWDGDEVAGGDFGGGANGYGSGYGGSFGDVVGLGTSGGTRGATALRERGTSRFTDTRTRGTRRSSDYADDGGSGDGPGGKPPKRKGSWWRHWSWKKALAVAAGTGLLMFVLVAAAVVYEYENTAIPTAVSEAALQQSSTVYFAGGTNEVGTFSADGIDRQMLASNQIPAVMKNAIVAAEDRNFYHEGGISITGIMRSAYEDLKGGAVLQGGSTLTQEFAKNYYTTIGSSRSFSTKLKEIFVAIKLSHEKSKDWIMTQYLNVVPFGDNAYGVAAAAQVYFNESAMQLTVSQAAMLAAMVNQPSGFSPDPSAGQAYTNLVNRWKYVLTNMARDGVLTQQQAAAQKFPKVSTVNQLAEGWTGFKGYVMQQVESELENTYGFTQQQIDTGGLKIVTTINLQKMNALYRAVNQNLATMRSEGAPMPRYAHVGAILEQPGTGNIVAMYGGPNFDAPNCAKIDCQLNMATQNREQVGSSFKPYVLATAVSQGMDVQNSILNGIEPMCVPPDSTPQDQMMLSLKTTNCPASFFPVNIQGENMGPLSVPKAAALSSDPGFEDLVHRVGTQATINMAKQFGVNTADYPDGSGLQAKAGQVGMALGTASLTVEEQATTFATLANDGVYVTPHVIAKITESNGNTVPLKITRRVVLNPAQAADVDYALTFDTNCNAPGTGPAACGTAVPNGELSPLRPMIGKTGTTDNAQSAFFLGAIPQYSLAVGMFTNQQNGSTTGQSLNGLPEVNGQGGGFGGTWPATIWRTFMQDEFASLPILPLPATDFNGFVKWDQVPKQPAKPQPHRNPGQNLNPDQNCPGHHHRLFGLCPPAGGGPTPPTPTTPSPTSSATPTPTAPPPTFAPAVVAAVPLALAAEEPSTTAVRSPGSG
jgi:membrane peptidoglycan carboxypeptidase